MIVWNMRHDTRQVDGGWECWACGQGGPLDDSRWEHEQANEGEVVEYLFDEQRVQDYVDWIFEIEDSEIEAYEEIKKSSGPNV